ncbi:MAG: acetyl-CoA C-acyltransferase FadI [Acidobacteria bacterium]|nr:MAG: acetyl-CoA C-acyltransferase FadI [Acidobacteriota bacterium]
MHNNHRRVAIVDGCRTPFAKAGTLFKHLTAYELGRIATVELLNRTELDPNEIDEVIFGTVIPTIKTSNIAREIALDAGIPKHVPAFSVARACASANQAIVSAAEAIMVGRCDTVIAGGAESLSDPPILFSPAMRQAFLKASKAKSLGEKIGAFRGIGWRDLAPEAPAIAERVTGLTMGESAEKMAKENGISREEQDRFAYRSHRLAAAATDDGRLTREIVPTHVPPDFTITVKSDNGIRRDTSLEALAALPPVFDRQYGSVTAGNSSPLTDGASALLIMSEEKAKALGYEPLGYIRSYAFAALSPWEQLLMGPAYAAPVALDRAGLTLKDMDLIEMHEAFAAQVLSNIRAFESRTFAREKLGREEPLGEVDMEKVNVCGGSIAIGHPFGATGGRLTITILNELKRRGGQFGLITVCAAGAMGFAMVVERE